MRLFDATLDLARYAQGVEQHKITSVQSTSKFSCNSLSARLGEYTNGGTVWFLSGSCEGQFGSIMRGREQVVETEDIYPEGFNVGDDVALSWFHYFNTQNLVNAVNHVLYDYPIMDIYDDSSEEHLTYKHNVYEYELPPEVGIDVRRVELQCKNFRIPFSETLPDTFTTCHYWHLNGRTLVIDPRWVYKNEGRIRIYYVRDHGPVLSRTGEISEQVDKNYLRKMANLWLWTHEIQMKHKDNPIAVDMFNQAKMDEESLNKKNIPESRLMPKDICYFW